MVFCKKSPKFNRATDFPKILGKFTSHQGLQPPPTKIPISIIFDFISILEVFMH